MIIKLFFDGACSGNNTKHLVRKASCAWAIYDENDNLIKSDSVRLEDSTSVTNNIAEWSGLLFGLKYLHQEYMNYELQIYGDSQIVINQIIGEFQVKKDSLILLFNEAKEILSKCKAYNASWIPREQNSFCDSLCRKCLD